ncbi:TIM barrel protein, partial [candidate division KSB3 bacterium]|nr:TIM barrel protein [candidate division KSB3 bacterium]MBD3325440.1 TIM barrel protein [candidate division KSB3 bacterium]
GFDGVLLMAKRPHLSPLDSTEDQLLQVKETLEARHMQLIGLACYNDFLLPAAAEVPVRDMQLAYLEQCCRITAFLGGKLLRVFTGYERADMVFTAQWEQVVSALQECGDRAARYGITVAVQNHHDLAVETSALELLLAEVDRANVTAGYDAWSPFLRGENIYEGARRMAKHMVMTIAANYLRFPRYTYDAAVVNYRPQEPDFVKATSMEAGAIDYELFFKGLKEGGFDGWAVYEMCSPVIGGPSLDNLDQKAAEFLSFMRSL